MNWWWLPYFWVLMFGLSLAMIAVSSYRRDGVGTAMGVLSYSLSIFFLLPLIGCVQ